MRHFLLFTLIIALAVPTPLFGNVIVKRQTADDGRKQGIELRKMSPMRYS